MDPTMSASSGKPGFFNYPTPCKGPDVPNENRKLQNPRLKGRLLVAAAFIMERSRFVRETAWKNAGFGSVRNIREHIMEHEPWFEPTVIPMPVTEAKPSSGLRHLPPQLEHRKFYSVSDYHAMYLSGEITPTDVALTLVPLIRRDTSPAGKHAAAWMDTNIELVMKAAKASTLRYQEKRSLGVLDGVPTGIKDDYDMDGYATHMGSLNDYAAKPSDDSSITNWCVKKLEDAGAVILGKLTMNEFGLDTTGNNPNYETPRNPFNSNYYTGGSSSGPGYAVGTGLVPIALGSDGGGSIRIPASYCSVFGLKPTHARLSCHPSVNHASTCSVQGPLAADIHSLAAVYEVIAEPHPSTQFPPLALQPSPPLTKVLGVDENWIARSEPGIQSLIKGLISKLCLDYGYHVVKIEIPFVSEGQTAHSITILTDGATLLPKTDNLTSANKILLALGGSTSSTDYLLAQKLRSLLMQHLAYLWQKYPGMLIITPTTACAGSPISGGSGELNYGLNDGNHTIESMVYVWLANYCGLPALTVPAGYVVPKGHKDTGAVGDETTEGKVPVGLMATGEWCSESALLKFGIDAEAAAQEARCKPPTWEDVISTTKIEAKLNRTEGSQGTSD
ncbi:amidase signature domain-containing protein [Dactylonectria estremocensis]|uniref:Amidase signature domain-containing protein n=1 Tax=Dactylonectria estremocensis TaxID=1079267 RepID=A0A9P9E5A6_9HYPO|nr:amidase signature domain-containing protein [Dactylonectria estremocensis]